MYIDAQINRANQDKLQLESNVRIYKDQLAAMTKDPSEIPQTQKSARLLDADRELDQMETQLANLRDHYKENHPDVQAAIARLEVSRKKRDRIAKEDAATKDENAAPKPPSLQAVRESRDLENTIRRLQSAIEGRDLEIQNAEKELKRLNGSIKTYQGRVETVPLGEKEYSEILRDREIARVKYVDLNEKLQKAEIAQEMEGRKQGETLELLDPASLPSTPTEPQRPMVISVGAALGLLLGIAIAAAREMKDTSLKNLKDVRAYTQVAILGSVPLLENDFVVRRRRRLAWLGWTTACLAATVIMSGSVVYYYVTRL